MPCAAGMDPAAGWPQPHVTYTTSDWPAYVQALHDPTVDEPEICRILGDEAESPATRELKDAASQRFADVSAAVPRKEDPAETFVPIGGARGQEISSPPQDFGVARPVPTKSAPANIVPIPSEEPAGPKTPVPTGEMQAMDLNTCGGSDPLPDLGLAGHVSVSSSWPSAVGRNLNVESTGEGGLSYSLFREGGAMANSLFGAQKGSLRASHSSQPSSGFREDEAEELRDDGLAEDMHRLDFHSSAALPARGSPGHDVADVSWQAQNSPAGHRRTNSDPPLFGLWGSVNRSSQVWGRSQPAQPHYSALWGTMTSDSPPPAPNALAGLKGSGALSNVDLSRGGNTAPMPSAGPMPGCTSCGCSSMMRTEKTVVSPACASNSVSARPSSGGSHARPGSAGSAGGPMLSAGGMSLASLAAISGLGSTTRPASDGGTRPPSGGSGCSTSNSGPPQVQQTHLSNCASLSQAQAPLLAQHGMAGFSSCYHSQQAQAFQQTQLSVQQPPPPQPPPMPPSGQTGPQMLQSCASPMAMRSSHSYSAQPQLPGFLPPAHMAGVNYQQPLPPPPPLVGPAPPPGPPPMRTTPPIQTAASQTPFQQQQHPPPPPHPQLSNWPPSRAGWQAHANGQHQSQLQAPQQQLQHSLAHQSVQHSSMQQHQQARVIMPAVSNRPAALEQTQRSAEFCSAEGSNRQSKELLMSPKTRALYKAFSHKLRSKETQCMGMSHAQELAHKCMAELPAEVHWRVHLEMADLAKRGKDFHEARRLYRLATELQPQASQTWLEYAKMEEERGHFVRCRHILTTGLKHCPYHEALMLKAIKHLERMGDLGAARALLGTLHCIPINQSWRTLLEGALLEARSAETGTARRVFKFLLTQAPWFGPVWHEACRFEQRCNHLSESLNIAEAGLLQLARYGPLWFCALRLYECTSSKSDLLKATRNLVERGVRHISKDLVWKLWFESAQVEERNGNLLRSRAAYVKSVATCAANLRWKVWLGGARTELCSKEFTNAQALLERAFQESPPKTRAIVMLEQSRLHELCGSPDLARKLLKVARKTNRQEWKVFLESVLLELRAQDVPRALREARKALQVHRGTGRLWAALIQLEHAQGVEQQLRVFQQALNEVPKSGEVWCEGARICLNPFSAHFNLETARKNLDFAIEFTPQYGDSFIEYLRLLMLLDSPRDVLERDLERLWQLCINAEPNYGTLWFHCKTSVLMTTRHVLQSATDLLERELLEWRHVYDAARHRCKMAAFQATAAAAAAAALGYGSADGAAAEAAPPVVPPLEVAGEPLAEASDFMTGSVSLNRMQRRINELTFEQKRCLIYGGDMIVP